MNPEELSQQVRWLRRDLESIAQALMSADIILTRVENVCTQLRAAGREAAKRAVEAQKLIK